MRLARTMRALRCPLAADQRGVSVIEVAFMMPIIATLIVGITDVSRAYSLKLSLEQAANRAVEKAAVGSVYTNYDFLKPEVVDAVGGTLADVTVNTWLECDGAKQTDFEGECPDGQMVTRYLKISVTQKFTPSFAFGKLFKTASDGTVALTGDAALRLQ
ncbi:MAG TPA: TadE family protein [Allosphingosinicella sp.]